MQTSVRVGGVYHPITQASAVHAAGAWQQIKQIWAKTGGVWQQVYLSQLQFSITAAIENDGGSNLDTGYDTAFYSPYTFGTLNSAFLPGGTLKTFLDDNLSGNAVLAIAYASDPGQSLFTTITANSVAKNSSAATYTYSGGKAKWVWAGVQFGLGGGATYPVLFT